MSLPVAPQETGTGLRARLRAARDVERALDRWASWVVLGLGVSGAAVAAAARWIF